MEKDAVLPLPVSAHPRMSHPDRAIGIPWDWIGVGVSYLWWLISAMMLGWRFCRDFHVKRSIVGEMVHILTYCILMVKLMG